MQSISSSNIKKLPLVLLISVLSACSSQPAMPETQQPLDAPQWQTTKPESVQLQVSDQTNDQAENSENKQLVGWWQSWQDPILNELLEQVLHNNPSLNSAGINYQIALLQAGISTAAYRPRGSASAGVSESGNEKDHNTSYNVGLNVSWELDLWGTRRAERAKAKATSERNLSELHAAQVSLIAQVVQTYVNLRNAQQNKQLAQQAIALRQQSYDLARWQQSAGLTTELQQAQALTLLKQTEASLPPHERAELEAIQQLQALAGGDLSAVLTELKALDELPQASELPLVISADVLRQRPDVQAKELTIKEQNEAIVLARHARYPSFALSGSISSKSQNVADLFSADTVVASLAANLSYLLFDGGQLRQNVKIQKLRLEQSLENYRAILLTAEQEVTGALTALDSNQRQQTSFQQAMESAELAANLAKMQYDYGLLNFSELLDAQTALLNSRSSLLSNQAAVLNSWVQLYRSIGGGWQGLALPSLASTTGTKSE